MSTDQSSNLGLPFLMPSQAQKHVTVNESLLRLDALVQLRAESRTVASQPGSPTDGRIWILPPGKTGADWGGYANGALAYWRDGVWEPISPREGWRAWVVDEGVFVRWTGSAWTSSEAVDALNGGPLAGLRNALINGCFRIWQRGASFASPATGSYLADRWRISFNGSGATRAVDRQAFTPGQTDVPGEPDYWCRVATSVAGSGATNHRFSQRIENVRTLAGRTATLSFYAKAAAPLTLGLAVQQVFGSGGSTSVETSLSPSTASVTTAWQKFRAEVAVPSISGKTIGPAHYLQLDFLLPLNATFTLDLAQIQLEFGGVATPLEQRPAGLELALCQRYFEKSFEPETAPAQNVGTNTGEYVWDASSASIGTQRGPRIPFLVQKRAAPTLVGYNPNAANGEVRDLTAGADCSSKNMIADSTRGFILTCAGAAGTAVGNRLQLHWTAEAEL